MSKKRSHGEFLEDTERAKRMKTVPRGWAYVSFDYTFSDLDDHMRYHLRLARKCAATGRKYWCGYIRFKFPKSESALRRRYDGIVYWMEADGPPPTRSEFYKSTKFAAIQLSAQQIDLLLQTKGSFLDTTPAGLLEEFGEATMGTREALNLPSTDVETDAMSEGETMSEDAKNEAPTPPNTPESSESDAGSEPDSSAPYGQSTEFVLGVSKLHDIVVDAPRAGRYATKYCSLTFFHEDKDGMLHRTGKLSIRVGNHFRKTFLVEPIHKRSARHSLTLGLMDQTLERWDEFTMVVRRFIFAAQFAYMFPDLKDNGTQDLRHVFADVNAASKIYFVPYDPTKTGKDGMQLNDAKQMSMEEAIDKFAERVGIADVEIGNLAFNEQTTYLFHTIKNLYIIDTTAVRPITTTVNIGIELDDIVDDRPTVTPSLPVFAMPPPRRRKPISKIVERQLLADQLYRCKQCNTTLPSTWEVDHIQPLHRGGDNHYRNLQVLCPHCHGVKTQRERLAQSAETSMYFD